MRIVFFCVLSIAQKAPAMDLPRREKNPAVATAAFCDPRPTETPAPAAAPHGVRGFADVPASPSTAIEPTGTGVRLSGKTVVNVKDGVASVLSGTVAGASGAAIESGDGFDDGRVATGAAIVGDGAGRASR